MTRVWTKYCVVLSLHLKTLVSVTTIVGGDCGDETVVVSSDNEGEKCMMAVIIVIKAGDEQGLHC